MSAKLPISFHCQNADHQRCVNDALAQAEMLCRQQKQRFTAIRQRVLELVWQQHKPIGAYEVLEHLQADGRTAPPTVYRALDFLQKMGLVHRIASLNAYVGCVQPGESHDGHFLICKSCHALAEINAPEIDAAIMQSASAVGFQPVRQTIEVMGLCPECSG
ncbi:MAG: Fur family transcriptional regulator [Desulfuromonadales bacterium]